MAERFGWKLGSTKAITDLFLYARGPEARDESSDRSLLEARLYSDNGGGLHRAAPDGRVILSNSCRCSVSAIQFLDAASGEAGIYERYSGILAIDRASRYLNTDSMTTPTTNSSTMKEIRHSS